MPKLTPIDLTRRESQIMEILYRRRRATVEDIRSELPDAPGPSSVRQLPEIMIERGLLAREYGGPRCPDDECGTWIMRRGLIASGVGVAAGLLVSWQTTRLLTNFLCGVQAVDVVTFGAAAIFLAMVSLTASFVPATRSRASIRRWRFENSSPQQLPQFVAGCCGARRSAGRCRERPTAEHTN